MSARGGKVTSGAKSTHMIDRLCLQNWWRVEGLRDSYDDNIIEWCDKSKHIKKGVEN